MNTSPAPTLPCLETVIAELDCVVLKVALAHLDNIALPSGKKIVWDAANEKISNDRKADKLVGVKYRKPWKLPYAKRA